MIITKEINMDLLQWQNPLPMDVVRDDRFSREVSVLLTADGVPWEIPEGTALLIRFRRRDGTGGIYDTMPDGSAAWSAEGNRLKLRLAPQVMTVPGPVGLTVTLIREETQLSTFLILLNVHDTAQGQEGAEEKGYITGFLPGPASAQPGQYLRVLAVDAQGKVTALEGADQASDAVLYTAQELTPEQREQARSNIGAMAADALPEIDGEDSGKILQVVDGAWAAVPVADSSVKVFVEEYISSALEGDY